MANLCEHCGYPKATDEDWKTYGEGEGEHLCWGDPAVCHRRAAEREARQRRIDETARALFVRGYGLEGMYGGEEAARVAYINAEVLESERARRLAEASDE